MSDLDAWIRAAARREFVPTAAEADELRKRMARAQFLSEQSLEEHVVERIEDRQWRSETTGPDFLDDLRHIIKVAPRLGIYVRRGGSMACVLGPTAECLRPNGFAVRRLALVFVPFSAQRDRLVSGYQSAE